MNNSYFCSLLRKVVFLLRVNTRFVFKQSAIKIEQNVPKGVCASFEINKKNCNVYSVKKVKKNCLVCKRRKFKNPKYFCIYLFLLTSYHLPAFDIFD